ncbi:hypothetical protein Fcan01_15655 [Folsomia candida]|uniref:Uncharacterized protein n=1 Tax=Folsomia candida TaxID=158441 RepID=A0A226DYR3_FOLCA|nr:hypothetical protein Fcan01_15655 [Folsomia candida]
MFPFTRQDLGTTKSIKNRTEEVEDSKKYHQVESHSLRGKLDRNRSKTKNHSSCGPKNASVHIESHSLSKSRGTYGTCQKPGQVFPDAGAPGSCVLYVKCKWQKDDGGWQVDKFSCSNLQVYSLLDEKCVDTDADEFEDGHCDIVTCDDDVVPVTKSDEKVSLCALGKDTKKEWALREGQCSKDMLFNSEDTHGEKGPNCLVPKSVSKFNKGDRWVYDPLIFGCQVAPWVRDITCIGHSECIVACPAPNCEVDGDKQCIVFDGADNHDFSVELTFFNDYFNSLSSCLWWNNHFKSLPVSANGSLHDA